TSSRSTTASENPLSFRPTAIASPATPPPRHTTSNSSGKFPASASRGCSEGRAQAEGRPAWRDGAHAFVDRVIRGRARPARPRSRRLDLHELLGLVLEQLVDLGGVVLRQLVDRVLELREVVLGELAAVDEAVGFLVGVAADVADGDALGLGDFLG